MPTFDDFWSLARHARGRLPNPKGPARKAWERMVNGEGVDPRHIIAGYLGYQQAMDECDTDNVYRCQMATFINQERWEQYLEEPAARRYLAETENKLKVVGG